MGETLRSGATVISFFTWPRVSAVRQEGLLTTASDERSGKPAHSRVGSASASPRVFNPRAVARASGVNNPASQSAPPLRQGAPRRRNQKSAEALQTGTNA